MMINSQLLQKPTSSSTFSSSLPITKAKSNIRAPSVDEVEEAAAVMRKTRTTSSAENDDINNNREAVMVKAVVTVKITTGSLISNLFGLTAPLDLFTDLLGKTFLLELVSAELDPNTGLEKKAIQGYAHKVSRIDDEVMYETSFTVAAGFGEVGAVLFENEHHEELYIKTIHLHLNGFPDAPVVTIPCDSWAHSKYVNPDKSIFFTNKDDLGNPDSEDELARPVLGGKEHPYPRRCRTGRPRTKKDPLSEERSSSVYVPRDEAFAEVKQLTFAAKTLKSVLHAFLPQLEMSLVNPNLGFPYFTAIDSLFNEGVTNSPIVGPAGPLGIPGWNLGRFLSEKL